MQTYYKISKNASLEIGNHQGLLYLRDMCRYAEKILDVGCGEGTRLNTLLPEGSRGWGIDPYDKAISRAKRQYPRHNFQIGVGENLPYPDANFDLVYSAFAIEHCTDPEKFIKEMVRLCKTGGHIVILAPNYGAPARRSPASTENPCNKLFEGLLKDVFPYPGLDWNQVSPRPRFENIDDDTTFEPYLKSMIYYFQNVGATVEKYSSLWSLENSGRNLRKTIIRYLGLLGIWPFKFWGPQIFVSAVK
jgi:ubiquinone/menaquinone biosynthesis C-methylase UbiE